MLLFTAVCYNTCIYVSFEVIIFLTLLATRGSICVDGRFLFFFYAGIQKAIKKHTCLKLRRSKNQSMETQQRTRCFENEHIAH